MNEPTYDQGIEMGYANAERMAVVEQVKELIDNRARIRPCEPYIDGWVHGATKWVNEKEGT